MKDLNILKSIEFKKRFINLIMNRGKKTNSYNIFLNLLKILKSKNKNKDPFLVVYESILNIRPLFEIETKKIGKRVVHIPIPIRSEIRREFIAINWLIDSVNTKKVGKFENLLSDLIIESYNNKGPLKKRQKDLHDLAISNRFALKFRW
jgi:ribosomal protein S7